METENKTNSLDDSPEMNQTVSSKIPPWYSAETYKKVFNLFFVN